MDCLRRVCGRWRRSAATAADAVIARSAAEANEALAAATKNSEDVLARLVAAHERAIADKDARFAEALRGGAAAVDDLRRRRRGAGAAARGGERRVPKAYDALTRGDGRGESLRRALAAARAEHADALRRLKDEKDAELAAAGARAAASTAARVEELSAELAGVAMRTARKPRA